MILCATLVCGCGEPDRPPESGEPGASGPPTVSRWPDGRRAAASFTFDDGFANHVEIVAPLLEKHGFRGTFFLVGKWHLGGNKRTARWARWVELDARGHEIGSHTMTHVDLQLVRTEALLREEIGGSARIIEQKIGQAPHSFAYPMSRRSDEAQPIVDEYYALSRGPCRIYGGEDFTLGRANGWIDEVLESGGWMVAMLHSVGEDIGWQPIDAELFDEHLAYVAERTDELWVDTHSAVGRYAAERDRATLTVLDRDPTGVSFTLTLPEDMKPEWFDAPLEVVIDLPGWVDGADASRPGGTVGMSYDAENTRIVLDVVPGPEPVTVSWRR